MDSFGQRCPRLRDYQEKLVAEIRGAFRTNRRVLAVSPTGSGKTLMFVYISNAAAARGKRVLIVAHRTEIVEQISDALDGLGVRHGRILAAHSGTDDSVQVGMIVTVARRADRIPSPDLLVIDEAHHGVAGSWRAVAESFPDAKVLGVTATPQRLDGRGLGAAFDALVIGPTTADLIARGFLSGFDYLAPPMQADLSAVKTVAGDFAIGALADAMDKTVITGSATDHYAKYLNGRPAIAFCVTVEHAEHVAEQFRAAGFRAASVDGKLHSRERRDRIAAIGNGRLQVLTSCEIVSEGLDVPCVAGAILLRPTKSLGLYMQQCGRVLRSKPDGSRALILDHVGNVHRHGLPDAPREWTLDSARKKPREPSLSVCETCFRAFPAGLARTLAAECPHDPCPMLAPEPAPRAMPEQREGELVAVVDNPATARMRTAPLRELLRGARTRDDLEAIRVARGYAPGWTWYVMNKRRNREASA